MPKTNNAYNFRIQQDMMTATGVWPKANPSALYKLKAIASWFFSLGLFFIMGVEVVNDLNDYTKLSEILYIEMAVIATILKLGAFVLQKKKFLEILEFLKDPVFVSYPDHLDHHMAKAVKYSTLLANCYRYLVAGCVTLYLVYPLADHKQLPFPFPYDVGNYRAIMYIFEIIGEGTCAWNNSCMDTLTTGLMGIASAQLDILCGKISGIKHDELGEGNCEHDSKTDAIIMKKLKQCVEHHSAIIFFIESVESLFTFGLLVQFVTSVMIICNTVFHIVLISTINSQFFLLVNYFMVMVTELFMYCWYGNEVLLKSENIRDACYTFNWYNSGVEVRKQLFIIMERSKRPLTITTMKLSKLSLTAFTSILQWSYSCLALLLKMYWKESNEE